MQNLSEYKKDNDPESHDAPENPAELTSIFLPLHLSGENRAVLVEHAEDAPLVDQARLVIFLNSLLIAAAGQFKSQLAKYKYSLFIFMLNSVKPFPSSWPCSSHKVPLTVVDFKAVELAHSKL